MKKFFASGVVAVVFSGVGRYCSGSLDKVGYEY